MGVNTGFIDLDSKLEGGFQKGCLYVLAARPAMGKTSLAVNMIDYICFKEFRTVAYFSLDMSRRQMIDRVLAIEAGIDPYVIRKGELDGEDWHRFAMAAKTMGESKLIIDDTPGINVQKLRSRCFKYRKESDDLAVIFIDYLQLISGFDNKSKKGKIAEILKSLKNLARELDRPIVILSKIPRTPEYRADHRPILSDFNASDAISQYADIIMFLYRDEYYHRYSRRKGVADVIIAKNSVGSIGTIELRYQASIVRFENIHR